MRKTGMMLCKEKFFFGNEGMKFQSASVTTSGCLWEPDLGRVSEERAWAILCDECLGL